MRTVAPRQSEARWPHDCAVCTYVGHATLPTPTGEDAEIDVYFCTASLPCFVYRFDAAGPSFGWLPLLLAGDDAAQALAGLHQEVWGFAPPVASGAFARRE